MTFRYLNFFLNFIFQFFTSISDSKSSSRSLNKSMQVFVTKCANSYFKRPAYDMCYHAAVTGSDPRSTWLSCYPCSQCDHLCIIYYQSYSDLVILPLLFWTLQLYKAEGVIKAHLTKCGKKYTKSGHTMIIEVSKIVRAITPSQTKPKLYAYVYTQHLFLAYLALVCNFLCVLAPLRISQFLIENRKASMDCLEG